MLDNELMLKAKTFVLYETSDSTDSYTDGKLTMLPLTNDAEEVRQVLSIASNYDGPIATYNALNPTLSAKVSEMLGGKKCYQMSKGQFDLCRHHIDIGKTDNLPIPTGLTGLDNLIGGFMRQTLITLGAAPGAGKTTIAMQILEHMADDLNHKPEDKGGQKIDVAYFHIEMSRKQLLGHSLVRVAKEQELWSGKRGEIELPYGIDEGNRNAWTKEQRPVMEKAEDYYYEKIAPYVSYFTMDDNQTDYAKVKYICDTVAGEVARLKALGRPAPLICVDYLQLVIGKEEDPDTAERIKGILLALKSLAIQYDTVVLVIVANNRTSNSNGITTMESGRDTSSIEYTADTMLALSYKAVELELVDQETMRTLRDGGEIVIPSYLDEAVIEKQKAPLKGKLRNKRAEFERRQLMFENAKSYVDQICLKVLKGRGVGVGRVYMTFDYKAHLFNSEDDFFRYNGPTPFDER